VVTIDVADCLPSSVFGFDDGDWLGLLLGGSQVAVWLECYD
jgi:hypothetical protein